MKKRNKMFYPLLLAVILIWSIIGLRVYESMFANSDELIINEIIETKPITENLKRLSKEEKVTIPYEKLDFDPFSKIGYTPYQPKPKSIEKKSKPKKNISKKAKLNYVINGIIINPNSRMIILEDKTNKSTSFLHEGEVYKGIKIVKIESNKITYQHENETKEYLIK